MAAKPAQDQEVKLVLHAQVRRPADYNPTAPGLLSQPSNQPILASAISAATQPTATGHASLMPPSAFSQAPSPAPMPPMGPGTPATAGGLPLQSTAQPTTGLGGVAPNLPQQNGLGATHSAGAGQLPGGTGPNDVSMSSRQVSSSPSPLHCHLSGDVRIFKSFLLVLFFKRCTKFRRALCAGLYASGVAVAL